MSPGARALSDHARRCRQCRETAKGNHPVWFLCGAGWVLAQAALKARARRAVSA